MVTSTTQLLLAAAVVLGECVLDHLLLPRLKVTPLLSVLAVRGHLLLKHPLPAQTQVLALLRQLAVVAAASKVA
jgi:hypothetical protein